MPEIESYKSLSSEAEKRASTAWTNGQGGTSYRLSSSGSTLAAPALTLPAY